MFNANLNTIFIFCRPKAQLSMLLTLRPKSFSVNIKCDCKFRPKNVHQKCLSNLQNSTLSRPRIKFGILKQFKTLLGRNSQNFLSKFVLFFVTFGLEILRLYWLKVVFEADINTLMLTTVKTWTTYFVWIIAL